MNVIHQWTESDDLEDTLQREESGEDDVEVLQHGFIEFWSSMELKDMGEGCFQRTVWLITLSLLADTTLLKQLFNILRNSILTRFLTDLHEKVNSTLIHILFVNIKFQQ